MKPGTEAWVVLAEIDYRSARKLLTLPDPIPETACYHAQRCVEKYLKAALKEADAPIPRTHDLGVLLEPEVGRIPRLAPHRAAIESMVSYAVDIRYPQDPILFADIDEEAEQAVAAMTEVRSVVRVALGPETAAGSEGA